MTVNECTERLLAEGESKRLEFKTSAELMDSIAQTVCAFLNAEGGVVIAGVDEHGQPNGLATEDQSQSLHKFLRETITPSVLYDVTFDHTSKGNVVSVSVPAGPDHSQRSCHTFRHRFGIAGVGGKCRPVHDPLGTSALSRT
jgi:predicted HTH transcriptional regulator